MYVVLLVHTHATARRDIETRFLYCYKCSDHAYQCANRRSYVDILIQLSIRLRMRQKRECDKNMNKGMLLSLLHHCVLCSIRFFFSSVLFINVNFSADMWQLYVVLKHRESNTNTFAICSAQCECRQQL